MTRKHFAEGEVLFKEGDLPGYVFRLVTGAVDIFRELDGERILLGTVGAGEFIGEMRCGRSPPQRDRSSRQQHRVRSSLAGLVLRSDRRLAADRSRAH